VRACGVETSVRVVSLKQTGTSWGRRILNQSADCWLLFASCQPHRSHTRVLLGRLLAEADRDVRLTVEAVTVTSSAVASCCGCRCECAACCRAEYASFFPFRSSSFLRQLQCDHPLRQQQRTSLWIGLLQCGSGCCAGEGSCAESAPKSVAGASAGVDVSESELCRGSNIDDGDS
jgi:hypothetical protein